MQRTRGGRFLRTLGVLALAFLASRGETQADGGVELARGPYLQVGTSTSVVVRWRTDVPVDSRVVFGAAAECPGNPPVPPQPGSLASEVSDPTPVTEHELTISGLEPNTRYYYAVGFTSQSAFSPLAGADDQHFFDTAPPIGLPKPTRVWVLGDSGLGGAGVAAVRDSYEAFSAGLVRGGQSYQHTDLWLMLGDNAYPWGSDQEYQENLFEVFPEMLARSVLWPTVGNHDLWDPVFDGWPYYASFTMPREGEAGGWPSANEAYYSFDYGNIHFISLDSQDSDRSLGGAMLQWLVKDLQGTTQDWIVAFWHHPPYSKGSHDSDDDVDSGGRMRDMRQNVLPLLEDYGVDLVLCGHSHSYERSFLLDGHYGDSSSFVESMKRDPGDGNPTGDGAYLKPWKGTVPYPAGGDGAVYTVLGSSSQVETGSAIDLGGTGPNHPAMASTVLVLGSVILDFNGNVLEARFLDDEGTVIDRFDIVKGGLALPPLADFEADDRVVLPGTAVAFADLSTNDPTLWRWDFGNDGSVESNAPDPVRTYPVKGAYDVALSVSNSAGQDALVHLQYICAVTGGPAPIDDLRLAADRVSLDWTDDPGSTSYQVVRGDLGTLRSSHGDYAQTGLSCLGPVTVPHLADPTLPAAGAAFFYLARGASCAPETGSYDSTADLGLAVSRDLGVQGAPGSCPCAPGDDADGDVYCNAYDTCPSTAGDPSDLDGDGLGDVCDSCALDPGNDADADGLCADADNCPSMPNPPQLDFDDDGLGDACDPDDDNDLVPDSMDGAPFDRFACRDVDGDGCNDCSSGIDDPSNDGIDLDQDGECDAMDTCVDVDGDGLGSGSIGNVGCVNPAVDTDDGDPTHCADVDGDDCEDCSSGVWNVALDGADFDSDGACDLADNCPLVANPGQGDLDADGAGNECDSCTDTDGDGFANTLFAAGTCPVDNCPLVANPTQSNTDEDLQGDACDSCPLDPENDIDQDGRCAGVDNCPLVFNPAQTDTDGDQLGNFCDPCTDTDGDGAGNPGFPVNRCPLDNCPTLSNPSQTNTDGDGWGDDCDGDDDGDGVPDAADQSPLDRFSCQDLDQDGCDDCASGVVDPTSDGDDGDTDGICDLTDPCEFDPFNDQDQDGTCAEADSCPALSNTDQADADGDGIGDACEYASVAGAFYVLPTEVTNSEYVEMLNSVAAFDTHGLFDAAMATDGRGGITRSGLPGSYQYGVRPFMDRKPVNFVSWLDAARYANWLHNGKPIGVEAPGTTETGAYDLTGPDPGSLAVRSSGAGWFLPTRAEWDQAAFGDPSGGSWLLPTHSDDYPVISQATAEGDIANPGINVANYGAQSDWNGQVGGNVTTVASAGRLSASAWGTYDQGGNVAEWVETLAGENERQTRGGHYGSSGNFLQAFLTTSHGPASQLPSVGFRIATATCIDADADGYGVMWTPGCSGSVPDNCPEVTNPDQLDTDTDGAGDLCDGDDDADGSPDAEDCASLSPGVSSPPGSIDSLELGKTPTATLFWEKSVQGHTTSIYHAVRLAGNPMPTTFSSCDEAETPLTQATASGGTPPGSVAYYTLSAVNVCGASAVSVAVVSCPSPGSDTDLDTIPDLEDNCAAVPNPDQEDTDGDFVGDACAPYGAS